MEKFIKALRKGKGRAQEELYQKYAAWLYRISYRYLKSREVCEEVLSQSFINIFSQLSKTDIETEKTLVSWMKRIVINQSLMELRKKVVFDYSLDVTLYTEESTVSSDENLLAEDLINMVMELPDGYRAVFSLYAIEGYSHEEIAKKLEINVGTSKSQLFKARKLLKTAIKKSEVHYAKIY